MKLIIAILVALGLGWLVDSFRKKSVSAPGVDRDAVASRLADAGAALKDQASAAASAAAPVADKVADTADAAMGKIAGAGQRAADTAQRVAPGPSGAVAASMNKAADVGSATVDKVTNVASKATDAVSSAAGSVADSAAGSGIADKASATASKAADAMSGAAAAVSDRLSDEPSGQASGESAGASQLRATGGQQASDETSAQEAFDRPFPATPPAGERPMEGRLAQDENEAESRTALAEPTPEAIEVYDDERDAIALRAPETGVAGGGQSSGQQRGPSASAQAQHVAGAMNAGAGGGTAAGASTASSNAAPRTGGTGGPSEETRFREAARTGVEVESRGASGQHGGAATQRGGQMPSASDQAAGGAMSAQAGAGRASGQSAAGAGLTASRSAGVGQMASGAPVDSMPGDGGYDCPTGYPVKGNASSHIYHQPGSRSYEQTKPEFCFRTVAAAEAAGYRIAKQALEAAGRPDLDMSEGLTGIGQSAGSAAGTRSVPAGGMSAAAGTSAGSQAAPDRAETRSGGAGAASHGGSGGTQATRTPAGAVAGDGTHRCPNGYPIKGNASSRIYHVPDSSSYEQTIPEFCFNSTGSAEAAGFRAPKR